MCRVSLVGLPDVVEQPVIQKHHHRECLPALQGRKVSLQSSRLVHEDQMLAPVGSQLGYFVFSNIASSVAK